MALLVEPNSVDAVVTDPPYGLSFMGQHWDHGVPGVDYWRAALGVLKPGGHLLAFGGTRTYHRMACAIEDAGFEIRDCLMWLYGSGFPKSHNGAHGGTALKPAHEPIILARKPLDGTVAQNFARYGTGGLNIDAGRVAATDGANRARPPRTANAILGNGKGTNLTASPHNERGRWPANVLHDGSDEVLAAFPDAPGQIAAASTSDSPRNGQHIYGALRRVRGAEPSANSDNSGTVGFKMKPGARRDDSGSAARFFYCAKANSTEREGNDHPTVKPVALMRYLCRLVTPAGGLVFDPFMGSGSTGVAAIQEGFRFVGCEREPNYFAIAEARVRHAS